MSPRSSAHFQPPKGSRDVAALAAQSDFFEGNVPMSYDPTLLFQRITHSLYRKPSLSLEELSRELRVSRRTIQNAVIAVAGKNFRELREELLLAKFQCALVTEPSAAIKELSSEIGYGSPRSFARAIRRACGVSPEQLRARLAAELGS